MADQAQTVEQIGVSGHGQHNSCVHPLAERLELGRRVLQLYIANKLLNL